MKAITLYQPWASLWAIGAKLFETRPWSTAYRGPLAIHAAKKPVETTLNEMFPHIEGITAAEIDFISALRAAFPDIDPVFDLPLGAVIATTELVACHRIVLYGGRGISSTDPGWLETPGGIYEPTSKEILFGDWRKGRYAWENRNTLVFDEPIPARGYQGLWDWTNERSA